MSKIAKDVRAGLKGIRGAGDAIRGDAMEAADELLDQSPDHPRAQASEARNQAIKEKGKAQLESADGAIGHRHGTRSKTAAAAAASGEGM
ncbi:hypothetical protein KVR01_011242 [Diaporthe batatas]|uniref:uncharacterized protein n=1 Tax=Diaporthe batatas TaxID=748121 RepID=UPI001D058D81|nr:uncharacterized protein KVR01_011242 [Diaporthe batatas]KAG8158799.1 hypothetical protein KVR01_011242 [Diaporthe batatas]